jgi:predicted ATPase
MLNAPSQSITEKPHVLRLPAFATGFVGRQAETQNVLAHLASQSLVSIIGPGGMGKTRLAAQVFSEVAAQFADGAAFIELAPIHTTELLIAVMAQHLGVNLKGANDPGRWLLAHFADKSLLLVLDNFEQLLGSVAFIGAIKAHAPHVKLLVTSRERLGLPDEAVVELRGLPVTQCAHPQTKPEEWAAAERLFLQVARAVRPSFAPSDEDLTYIRRICTLADGMPLAIELAAAWVTMLPVRFIAEQVQQNLDWLTTSIGITYSPQKSVRAVFDYFWKLLSDTEQQSLRQLSVFRGGFARDHAQQVAGASLFFLSALVDRAFLSRTPTGRYQLHELLLQYASEQLHKNPDEARAAQRRHAQTMLAMAEQSNTQDTPTHQTEWHARLETELPNIRAALNWASQKGEPELALRLLTSLEKFWERNGLFAEASRWVQQALSSDSPVPPLLRLKTLLMAGRFQEIIGNFNTAHNYLTTAVDLAKSLGDSSKQASALSQMCIVNFRKGNFEAATECGKQAVILAKASEDRVALSAALRSYAMATAAHGRLNEALDLAQQSLGIARELNDMEGVASALNDMAIDLTQLGQLLQGEQNLKEALAINQQNGNLKRMSTNLLNLGWISHLQGDEHGSLAYNRQALSILQQIGSQETAALVWLNLGDSLLALNTPLPEVARHYHQAITIASRIHAGPIKIYGVLNAAHLGIKLGEYTRAAEWLGLVMNHPSSNHTAHTNAQPYIETLRQHLPTDELEALMTKGASTEFSQAVQSALEYLQDIAQRS